ncbi:2-polyprenyl-3-methyl-5-hydroxy-6-metoxy-1,4-benzoquinol methylase [Ereboglobus sp. PH5-5]|uniref:methyltransferase domain-containing protein n=1 Tax=Ereboglobus sp. PH5-5 TaxID=2940529 RepID=UPI002406AC57|nr:methyltransferase domain-containing protein [Ereboglobus sp. PH5-5]MDF9831980.1 2-polyprenyl-3-methyl-5-hydroxy-6-metoxy-1,4-benzoquinol methylase [Ereboglobus sp. PH5-5]
MRRFFSPDIPELMDVTQSGDATALEKDLDDLESLNARFGGHEIIQQFLPLWIRKSENLSAPETQYRILDLATASGDIPRMIADWARAQGIKVRIDAVDFNPLTIGIARKRSTAYPEINYIEADILKFEPGGGAYDVVICSQALHHFSEDDAVRVLRLCREASRGSVLVSDLLRCWKGRFAIWLLTATVYRRAMMKYDSRLSVRRAFTENEICELARRAGWSQFEHRTYFPVRQAFWMRGARENPKPSSA